MSASISGLIPELRPFARQLLLVAGNAGLQPRLTSTYRSRTEQARLYRRFLAGQNPYPVAPPGHSAHEAGYAFDMMIMDAPGQMESDLADLGQVWESWGGIWGGHFKDSIHFEFPGFSAPRELSTKAHVANIAASFLPGPAGILASVQPVFADEPTGSPFSSPANFGAYVACKVFGRC